MEQVQTSKMTNAAQNAFDCYYCEGSFSHDKHLQLHIATVHEEKKTKLATAQILENSENAIDLLQTIIVPKDQNFQKDDFVVRMDDSNKEEAPIWRFDGTDMLQRFNITGKDENSESLYKSTNFFSGYMTSNRQR